MRTLRLLLALAIAALTGCSGLAIAYTRDVAGQTLTGFLAADGTYGFVGKQATGKAPAKVAPQK